MNNQFNAIVQTIFHVDPSEIRDDMTPADIPQWDSMNYLLFIAELEKTFNMTFEMNEVLSAQTLGDIRRIVQARTQQ